MALIPHRPSVLIPLLLAGAPLGCDDLDPEGFPPPQEFRTTVATLYGTAEDGHVCFDIAAPCATPQSMTIDRDGVANWSWVADDSLAFPIMEPIPTHACMDTGDVPEGAHTYVLHAQCDGGSSSSSPQEIRTSHASGGELAITGFQADQTYYEASDEIVLQVQTTQAYLAVFADLSAIDSSYLPGAETVTDLGGGLYELRYTLSTSNTAGSGDYRIPVTAMDPAGGAAEQQQVTLRYLPQGPMRTRVAGGVYHPQAPTSRSPDGTLTLTSVVDTGLDEVASTMDDEHPTFDPAVAPGAAADGRRIQIDFRTAGSEPVRAMALDVREPGRDGFMRVPLDVSSPTCNAVECSYQAEVVVANRDQTQSSPALTIQAKLVTELHESAEHNAYTPAMPPPQPTELTLSATVTYVHQTLVADCPNDPNTHQRCEQIQVQDTRPARHMSVKILDDCGGVTQAWTDDLGQVDTVFETLCPGTPVDFRVSSYGKPSPLTVSVFRRAVPPPNPFPDEDTLNAALTTIPGDYTVHTAMLTEFVPSQDCPLGHCALSAQDTRITDETLAIPIQLAEVARDSLDYFDQYAGLGSLVHVNILWDPNEVVTEGMNTAIHLKHKSRGFIRIPVQYGWSDFAVAHELGHVFHTFFVRDHGPLTPYSQEPYGRFGEPMANAHAAAITGGEFMLGGHNPQADANYTETMDYQGNNVVHFDDPDAVPLRAAMEFFPNVQAAANSLSCGGANPDECCSEPNATAQGNCVMAHSQGWDWRVFYDLTDGTSGQAPEPVELFEGLMAPVLGFDLVDGGLGGPWAGAPLMDVLLNYLGKDGNENLAYEDRGMTMVDLVDVLDGMICRGHIVPTDLEAMLEDAMGYDYSYSGIACP